MAYSYYAAQAAKQIEWLREAETITPANNYEITMGK
jgi:hypothetical protein